MNQVQGVSPAGSQGSATLRSPFACRDRQSAITVGHAGTWCSMLLPRRPTPDAVAPGIGGAVEPAREGPAGLRIVIVEDEAIISMEIEELLVEMGAEVVGTALNAEQAVDLAEKLRPDCLTMDIRIQGERDGISAAIEIYERFGIRSLFVSAFGNSETVARAQTASPLGWIAKPILSAELEAALSQATPRNEH